MTIEDPVVVPDLAHEFVLPKETTNGGCGIRNMFGMGVLTTNKKTSV